MRLALILMLLTAACAGASARLPAQSGEIQVVPAPSRIEIPLGNQIRIEFFRQFLSQAWLEARGPAAIANRYCGSPAAVQRAWSRQTRRFVSEEAAANFLKECLRDAFNGAAARRSAEAGAAALVGVLRIRSGGMYQPPECHAGLLSANSVVTAAHCFVADGGPTTLARAFREDNLFFVPSGSTTYYRIAFAPALPWANFRADPQRVNDFAILQLDRPVDFEIAVDGFASALGVGDNLFAPAYWFGAWAATDEGLKADADDELCRVASVASDGLCFIHACQTIPGVSGAPIYKIESDNAAFPTGRILFAGVHTGAAELAPGLDAQACGPEKASENGEVPTLAMFNHAVSAQQICNASNKTGICAGISEITHLRRGDENASR